MKNILFLNDYGEHAKYIYQYALRIGQHFNAKINAVHIFEMPRPIILEDDVDTVREYYDDLGERMNLQTEDEKERLKIFLQLETPKQSHDLIGKQYVREGDTATQVLDILEKEPIDLLIMGMNQQNKLENTLFGNFSLRMIDKTTCPVLLVPQKAMYLGIDQIAFAVDFGNHDLVSIQYMAEWATAFDARLHIIHTALSYSDHYHSEKELAQWKKHFAKEVANDEIVFHLLDGGTKEQIEEFIGEIGADLLGLSTHIRKFWAHLLEPSITKDLAREVDIPVLVIKPS